MIGDRADLLGRIKAILPAKWFQDATPVLDATLTGIAQGLSDVYGQVVAVKLQTRIATATDQSLDLISFDFFGGTLPRRSNETDTAFRARIEAQLLLERQTRRGMYVALLTLTGRAPLIFEPRNIQDTGRYNDGKTSYNQFGKYGSRLPDQAFVIAYRPMSQITGTPVRKPSYNANNGGYTNNSAIAATVSDQDIIDIINAVKPVGTRIWIQIQN